MSGGGFALLLVGVTAAAPFQVGSKKFTESVLLAEAAVGLARSAGVEARHRRELGGSRVLWEALLRGELDAYPEYTGTLTQELLPGVPADDPAALDEALRQRGLAVTRPLGFDNTYALGMREDRADSLGLRKLSDLASHPELKLGLSSEFLARADGWPKVQASYRLRPAEVRGLDHELAYRGLASGAFDLTDLYTTDAEISALGLRVLEDDGRVFPRYQAVLLYRAELATRAPAVVAAWKRLEGALLAKEMSGLNAQARLQHVPEERVAQRWLAQKLGVSSTARSAGPGRWSRLFERTLEHVGLVGTSLLLAFVAALPLGIWAAKRPRAGQVILGAVGIVQTLPSLALLVLTLPLLGIGARPAIAALFLYSLLPIVRNTHAGLTGLSPALRESAEALGLTPLSRLRRIELPLASPAILAGVQTAAVLNVGTATLGALIGAGGYGQPILTGIRLDDTALILEGALPAALLALGAQGFFELLGRWVIPRGLRL